MLENGAPVGPRTRSSAARWSAITLLGLSLAACAEPPGDPELSLQQLLRQAPPAGTAPVPFLQGDLVAAAVPAHAAPAGEVAVRSEEAPRRLLAVTLGLGVAEFLPADLEDAFEREQSAFDLTRATASGRDAIDLVQVGRADAAIVLGDLSARDVRAGLRQHELGHEVFALATGPQRTVHNLSQLQVRQLLTGQTGHWSCFGSDAGGVALVLPTGAVAERAARALIPGDPFPDRGVVRTELDEQVFDQLLRTPGAVGVVRLAAARRAPEIRLLAIDTVLPTAEAFAASTYPYGQRLILVVAGPGNEATARLLQFLRGEHCRAALGQRLLPAP